MNAPDEDHYRLVARRILDGAVIPFLGAGANLVDRPDNASWRPGVDLPSGSELASMLARKTLYPKDLHLDLLRVSQYVDALLGEKVLYEHLRSVFNADYPPTTLHAMLAALPKVLKAHGSHQQQLIITTNYDDALERAFDKHDQEYDVIWYEAKVRERDNVGRFFHRAPGQPPVLVTLPNEYDGLRLEERPVILKLHGAVSRLNAKQDSYVITENNYIDYLSFSDISSQIPIKLRERMTDSHFLFLGYSMRDWNMRVILNRIWGSQTLDIKSWAVQRRHENDRENDIEERLWKDRGDVDLLFCPLRDYVAGLMRSLISESASEEVG